MSELRCGLFWALVDKGKRALRTIVIAKVIKSLYEVSISYSRLGFELLKREDTVRFFFMRGEVVATSDPKLLPLLGGS